MVLPIRRAQWPRGDLSNLNWAIGEVIFGYNSAADDDRLTFAYVGALYIYCQVLGQDLDDSHLGAAVAALLGGTDDVNFGLQVQFLHFLSWAVAEIRRVRQRTFDPRPVLCYAAVVYKREPSEFVPDRQKWQSNRRQPASSTRGFQRRLCSQLATDLDPPGGR